MVREIIIIILLLTIGILLCVISSTKPTIKTTPNIIIENPTTPTNCTTCIKECNTILDDSLQTYTKIKNIQNIANQRDK